MAAISLLVVTVLKAFLFDLGRLGGLYRVGSFVGLAISLAVVAVLLQKFALRRGTWDRTECGRSTGIGRSGVMKLFLALFLASTPLYGSAFERPILPRAAGPNVLPINALAVVGSRPGFADLRITDANGAEVPYLLVPRETSEQALGQRLGAKVAGDEGAEQGIELELPQRDRGRTRCASAGSPPRSSSA